MRTLPDPLSQIILPTGTVTTDAHGYLSDPATWTPDFARHAAGAQNITLTAAHDDVIAFMRAYLDEHGLSPDVRFVLKFIAAPDNLSKAQAKATLFALFPYGYVQQACKIAGMRQPRAWSTG